MVSLNTNWKCVLPAVLIAVWAVCPDALAQSGPSATSSQNVSSGKAEANSGELEDVIVTARRTEESIQTTPVSVTALTSADIKQLQLVNLESLAANAPGLVVTQNHSGTGMSLRGQVQASSDSSVDQSVGFYENGVYIARQMGARFDLVDVNRIEVLHGPQGTLFGRNTTGGAVNVIDNLPTNNFEGSVMAGTGDYRLFEVTGIINLPLSDALSVRLVARHEGHDGYGEDVFLNRSTGNDDYNDFRATVRLAPSSDWSLVVMAEDINRQENGPLVRAVQFQPGLSLAPYTSLVNNLSFYDDASEQLSYEHISMYNTAATLTVNLGEVTFKSISSFRVLHVSTLQDFDTTPLPIFFSGAVSDIKQVSQEAQLFGSSGPFDYIGGLYYFDERGPEDYPIFGGFLNYSSHIDQASYAPFGTLTYHINDQLRVTGGVRYTFDQRSLVATNTLGGACYLDADVVNMPPCTASRGLANSYLSYNADVDYKLSDSMFLYARTGRGHKSGGFNKTNSGLQAFAPEEVNDYEVGFKSDLLGRRLRIDADTFVSLYKDMQRPITSDTTGVPIAEVISAGKSRLIGGELEITALPLANLEITGNIGLVYPKYLEFSDATGDLTHQPFTRVSKVTWDLAGTYSIPTNYGTYRLHTDYRHQSEEYFFPTVLTRQPGYGILDARASLELNHPNLEVAFWGKNLTKTKYYTEILDFLSAAQVDPGFPGDPLTFGVNATYRFGPGT